MIVREVVLYPTMGTEPLRVTIYSKSECCLCDEAKAVVDRVRRSIPFELDVVDLARHPDLLKEYGDQVPVIFVNGRKAFKYRVEAERLEARLRREQSSSS